MDGILACSHGPIFGEKVFYLLRGKRHWVQSGAWIEQNGFSFPGDVQGRSDEQLLAYLPGQPAPLKFSESDRVAAVYSTVGEARDAVASQLVGVGLEIGAGASPFPVPLDCDVQYGDMYSYKELISNAYSGQGIHDIVTPTLKTSLDQLEDVADNSLDFIVACHVIEHTRNPIGAIANAYRKLRPGGHLVLVVPDKERTFDRPRALTELNHLVDDFLNPDPARDEQHYQDFFSKAEGFDNWLVANKTDWEEQCRNNYSIHFHTWNYDSFTAMVGWITRSAAPYRSVWSHPTVSDGIEFYFDLTK